MIRNIFFLVMFTLGYAASAQVQKTVLVEHFTNSRCGVCASKNPGLYQNLASHPDVIHIAFHPSAPYASCIFSQYNPVENDNRTKSYSIYGGTPWIVINGQVQPSGTNFGNPALFDPFYGETTAFSLYIKEYRYEENNIRVEVTIRSVSAHAQAQAQLFLGFVEDTVFYLSPNGEPLHTDVFRNALTDVEGDVISLPATGDSLTLVYNIAPDAVWELDRMYAMAILQDISSKTILQSGKTDQVEYMNPNFIGSYDRPMEKLNIFPNPASGNEITIRDAQEEVLLFSSDGRLINRIGASDNKYTTLNIAALREGVYLLRSGNRIERLVVVK